MIALSLTEVALPRYLLVLLLCVAAYLVGRAILRRLAFDNLPEQVSVCTVMGLGALSHLILIVGWIGWLTPTAVVLFITTAAVAGFLYFRKSRGTSARHVRNPHSLLVRVAAVLGCVAGAALLAPLLILPFYPPTEFDVTEYHLTAPKMWIAAQAIIPTPFLRYQVGPSSAHTLFAALMLILKDFTPQILSLAAVGLVATFLYGWGKRAHSAGAGILAVALWLGSPAAVDLGRVASYHALAALFGSASIYALAVYAATRRLPWFFAAAALMGFAQSTWSGAFYFVPVLVLAAAYFSVAQRRSAPFLALAGGILLGWGPTLLRSAWYTGNPTYPLFPELFGPGPWWRLDELAGIAHDIRNYGIARTLKGFVTLPYQLVMAPEKFQSGRLSYSPVLVALLPLVAARATCHKLVRWLLALVFFYVTCWFIVGQIMRYLLPVIPAFCLAVALTICWLVDWICGRERVTLRALVIGLAAVFLLVPGARFIREDIHLRGPVPLTEQERADYIAARIPEYHAVTVANAAPAPLYSYMAINCAYYVDALFMGDWFGPGRYSQITEQLMNPRGLYDALHRLGAVYLLISRPHQFEPPIPYGPDFDNRFEPVYANAFAEVYRLRQPLVESAPDHPNLLENADFEALEAGLPVSWNQRGAPVVAAPPGGAAAGATAVHVSEADGFQQFVKVVPREIYELQIHARSDERGKSFRLQINWIDHEGKTYDVYIRGFDAKATWQLYAGRVTAPQRAERAEVFASGHGGDWVWLDSFVFRSTGVRSPSPKY